MDSGEGRFEEVKNLVDVSEMYQKHPNAKGIFRVGEELEIRGSRFRVKQISPFGIKLKLLKATP